MDSVIAKADRIVGIEIALGGGGVLDYADREVKNTFRRGAYCEWFSKHSSPDQWPTVSEILESQAERIVRLDAAKPKGDGLPEKVEVFCQIGSAVPVVSVMKIVDGRPSHMMDADELERLCAYTRLRFSKPVRRLLAEYEVTDERPTDEGIFALGRLDGEPVMAGGPPHQPFPLSEREVICYLMPKAVKP